MKDFNYVVLKVCYTLAMLSGVISMDVGCGCSADTTRGNIEQQCSADLKDVPSAMTGRADHSLNSGHRNELVLLNGGVFYMGTDNPKIPADMESPSRAVHLDPFYIDKYAVTNEEFDEFAAATSFISESENFGWSFVFHSAISTSLLAGVTQAVKDAEWWSPVEGAYWYQPEGPGTDVFSKDNYRGSHPVVQVSWNDANAYCRWRGARLPTEAEWEYAARGGLQNKMFPWGNSMTPNETHRMNIFQGKFPGVNSKADGYEFACPVDAFPPQNDFGLYNIMGNVWEWVEDWWKDPNDLQLREKVKKGGSFLCHKSYCYRYRNAARTKSTPDSATLNGGFRCAKSA